MSESPTKPLSSTALRQSFLDFFKSKGHTVVPSAPLLPSSPNLLFTNAGMNPFVPYFLAERPAPWPRAADTQKCIRAGGKHNDLDDVGFDTYHHTFFEMLGNWSFGDYFKEEAIAWAWELLTEVWGFPKARLYATVYKPGPGEPAGFDEEAFRYWEALFKREGLDPQVHILTGGKKDNFWMMGDTGPCGPCSEIHIDLTEHADSGGKLVNADHPRCMEIWNLVFIQFNAEADGSYQPLKARHVDTGMGFERVAGILATTNGFTDFSKAPSNYDCDLFAALFTHLANLSGHSYGGTVPENRADLSGGEMNDVIFRVLADHIRTLAFSIADGILPGNEGRNYVLRRILRRAVMFGKRINLPAGFFSQLVEPLIAQMSSFFPELEEQRDVILSVIGNEEQAFDRTLDRGLQLLDRITFDQRDEITGDEAFALYDTYGFPIDLTQIIARERGLKLDMEGFEAAMEKQRARARAARRQDVISVVDESEKIHSTQFVGYAPEQIQGVEAELVGHFKGENESFLLFAQSPFYAEKGGQVGDTGEIILGGQAVPVLDTVTDDLGHHLHKVAGDESFDAWVGKTGILNVNRSRRVAIERHHTATHMLNFALREVLGSHIRQAGSLVAPDHLRFDFSHYEAVAPEQLVRVEEIVIRHILANDAVDWYEIPYDEKPEDVVAVFGEKYGAIVRVVDIGGYSKELCGGTHTGASGELGFCKIISEAAIAAGTRRIEAVCGEAAHRLVLQNHRRLSAAAARLSCRPDQITERLDVLLEQRSELEKRLRGLEQKKTTAQGDDLARAAVEKDGLQWIVGKVDVSQANDLRGLAVALAKKSGPGVVVLGAVIGGKVSLLALCSPEAVKQSIKAGDLIRELAPKVGGKGGGKPDFAMGGGKDAAALEPALAGLLKA